MADRPKRPCRHPRCPQLTLDGYCGKHAKEKNAGRREYETSDVRREHKAFYGSQRWREFSEHLRKQPEWSLCWYCQQHGRVTLAKQIDHIKPRRDYPDLAFEPSNCRGSCATCHSRFGSKASKR